MNRVFQFIIRFNVTKLILTINILLFLLTVIMSQKILWFPPEVLVVMGANYGPYTVSGEWWRMLTSVFLHAGFIHLLFNSVILYQIGNLLEAMLERWLYITLYLTTGIWASASSLLFNYGVVSIGASGAIFGLYGFFAALLTTRLFSKSFKKQFLKSTWIFIGLNLLIGTMGPIDNAAHIGGLISGFISGMVLSPWLKKSISKRINRFQQQQRVNDNDPAI